MAVNSSSLVSSLGAGSGIDIQSLAKSLVEAERKPFKDKIDEKIAKTEAKILGYGVVRSYLEQFKTAFEKVSAPADFGSLSLNNSQPSAFTATLGTGAVRGTHQVSVVQLASGQRVRSEGFADAKADLNNGAVLTLTLTRDGTARPITVGSSGPPAVPATAEGIVKAINDDADANGTGLQADLVRYSQNGSTYFAIEVQGATGADQGLALSIDASTYRLDQDPRPTPPVLQSQMLSEATDARVRVDGQTYSSSTNQVEVTAAKLTLSLNATTATPATVAITRDTQAAKDNIKALVSSYNEFHEAMKILADRKSEVEELGGSLAGDSLIGSVRSALRSFLRGPDEFSGQVNNLGDLGIVINPVTGRMEFKKGQEGKLDAALNDHFDDTVRMFTGDPSTPGDKGLAGAVIAGVDGLLSEKFLKKGLVTRQTEVADRELSKYKDQLQVLEERMSKMLERYTKQFSIMETIVGSTKETKSGLSSSFAGMMAAYKN